MKRNYKKLLQIAAGVLLLMATPGRSKAQEIRPLAITDYGGNVSFEFLYEDETAKSETRDQKFEETTLRESVGFYTKGYIYHPNLFEFDIGLEFGLGQEKESGTFDEDRNTEFTEYDIHLAIEKKRPYGVELFALKHQDIVEFEFAPNAVVDVEEYGLLWQTQNPVLPTSVRLSHLTNERDGIVERKEEENRITVNSFHNLDDFSRTNIRYEFRDYTEKVADIELQDNELFISNSLEFGGDYGRSLYSSLRYFDETGTNQFEQIGATSLLTLEHPANFESFYRLDISDNSVSFRNQNGSVDTFSHSEEAGLRHLLYENLKSVAVIHNSDIDSDTFKQQRYGADLDFFYTRPIPVGRVDANLGLTLERTDERSEGAIPVVDEPHVLINGTRVFLDNVNVDLDSVFVTDVTGTIVYIEGIDYNLELEGSRVRIVRIFTGDISDGQQILVDYIFISDEDLLYDTTGVRAGFGLSLFDKIWFSYNFLSEQQHFISDEPEEQLVPEETTHRLDLSYYQTLYSGLHFEINSFYENRDSNFSPVESYGASALAGRNFWKKNEATISASYTDSTFPDTDDRTDVLTLTGTWISRLNPQTQLILEGVYRDIGGTIDDQTGLELRARLETSIRQLYLSINYSHIDVTEAGQDRESDFVFFKATRFF